MKQTYCYSVRSATTGEKLQGGTLKASSNDEAMSQAIQHSGAKIEVTGTKDWPRIKWMRKGKEVYIYLLVLADHYADQLGREQFDALPD